MAKIHNILLLDDSAEIGATVEALEREGYNVTWIDTMESFIECMEFDTDTKHDVLILDANLPGCEVDCCGITRSYNDPDGLNSYQYFFDKSVTVFDEYKKSKRVAFLTAYNESLQKRAAKDNRTSKLNEYNILA